MSSMRYPKRHEYNDEIDESIYIYIYIYIYTGARESNYKNMGPVTKITLRESLFKNVSGKSSIIKYDIVRKNSCV